MVWLPAPCWQVLSLSSLCPQKGYLSREKERVSYIYQPRITEAKTTRKMLSDLVNRVFDGSAATVVMNLLETDDIDAEELKRLRKLINHKIKGDTL